MIRGRALAFALLVSWSARPSGAEPPPPQLELSFDAISGRGGGVVRVPVRSRASAGVGAFEMDVVFDPAVLEFRGVSPGPLLPSALLEARARGPGRARVAAASGEPVTGEGVLMVVEFSVRLGPPTGTVVTIENLRAWDHADVLPLTTSSRPGDVSRVEGAAEAPSPPSREEPSPAVTGLWILGAALVVVAVAVLLVVRRRRAHSP
jgi:hypothetical protein